MLHFIYLTSFFALIIVLKSWYDVFKVLPFIIGGLLGTFLPYLDYLIYGFITKSGNKVDMTQVKLNKVSIFSTINQYYSDRSVANELIMHSALFQSVLAVFVLFVISSSGSLLARGIVLSLSLHLILDQVKQYLETKNLDSWFSTFPVVLESNQKLLFVILNIFILGAGLVLF